MPWPRPLLNGFGSIFAFLGVYFNRGLFLQSLQKMRLYSVYLLISAYADPFRKSIRRMPKLEPLLIMVKKIQISHFR